MQPTHLWQYQIKAEPVTVPQAETDIDTKAWRPILPDNVPRLHVLPMATQAGGVWTALHEAAEGNALDWYALRPDWLPPIHQLRPSGGVWLPLAGAVTDWSPSYPDWLPGPVPLRPSGLTWSTVTPVELTWLPCVWMVEGCEETMIASGATAYQEEPADLLRINGDPITLNGDPIRVVS